MASSSSRGGEQERGDALSRLTASQADADRRILIRGGTVLAMDPSVGDLARGDVLVHGQRIEAVGTDLGRAAADGQCIVVPAEDMIVMPGLQDTHRHCWQSQLRRYLSGSDLEEYGAAMHQVIAPHYRPEDTYAGNLVGALGAIDAGVTCLLDVSHNSRSSAHSDAAVDALRDGAIRASHASARPVSGGWDEQWPADMTRLKETYFRSEDQLLTLRLGLFATDRVAGASCAMTRETLAFARALGVGVSVDAVFGPEASAAIVALHGEGLLGPDITLIHCTDLSDLAWKAIADTGVEVSLCPTSDSQIGILDALPPIQAAIDAGVRAGLSVDVECVLSSDMFTQMQAIYTIQRMNAYAGRYRNDDSARAPIDVRTVLEMATVHGARMNGVSARSGSLTPGKDADIVLLGAEDINTMPLNNAVATVVLGADTRNVDTVFIAGRVRKWAGTLLGDDLTRLRRIVHESRDHLLDASGYTLDVLAD